MKVAAGLRCFSTLRNGSSHKYSVMLGNPTKALVCTAPSIDINGESMRENRFQLEMLFMHPEESRGHALMHRCLQPANTTSAPVHSKW